MTNVLIVGGTSGLGLELAKLYQKSGMNVYITGRNNPYHHDNPPEDGLQFVYLDLSSSDGLPSRIQAVVAVMPHIDVFVYAAGFYQENPLVKLTDDQIYEMYNVGLIAPTFLLRDILCKQDVLEDCILVTSTSQRTPRYEEPVYTATKAGLAMLGYSLVDPKHSDRQIQHMLIPAPAAMATSFWDGQGRDLSIMLNPEWVAQQIVDYADKGMRYCALKILRDPPRVEVVESML